MTDFAVHGNILLMILKDIYVNYSKVAVIGKENKEGKDCLGGI